MVGAETKQSTLTIGESNQQLECIRRAKEKKRRDKRGRRKGEHIAQITVL